MNREQLTNRQIIPIFPAYRVPFISTIFPQRYPPTKDPTPMTIVIAPGSTLSF